MTSNNNYVNHNEYQSQTFDKQKLTVNKRLWETNPATINDY